MLTFLDTTQTAKSNPVSTTQTTLVDIDHQYDGQRHWFKARRVYRNPVLPDTEKGPLPSVPTVFHRDVLGRSTWRPKDLLRYISPTYGKPYRMLVQAASGPDLLPAGDWRRVNVKGDAPALLLISSWVMGSDSGTDSMNDVADYVWIAGKTLLTVPAYFVLMSLPFSHSTGAQGGYVSFPGRCYEYPKHARNALDASPVAPVSRFDEHGDEYNVAKNQERLLRPRMLVVQEGDDWLVQSGDLYAGGYIFVSFAAQQFSSNEARHELEWRARDLAAELGVSAYWIDFLCRSTTQPDLTDDVHRFCDVVRGASRVCILLPDNSDGNEAEREVRRRQQFVFWGSR